MPEGKFPAPDHSPPSTLILLDLIKKSMKQQIQWKDIKERVRVELT
jgi:hypothetical protein